MVLKNHCGPHTARQRCPTLQDLATEPALWPADNKWLKARGRMIINGFEFGFLRPFYGLLLRCRR